MSEDLKVSEWNSSYERSENHLFFPKEELVKFLSRFIRRRVSADEYVNVADLPEKARALDYGCGLGRQSILLAEYGLNVTGIDISSVAIKKARVLADQMQVKNVNFAVASGSELDFPNNHFSLAISDCVLDSMTFDNARKCIGEIDRVCNGYFYFNLISGENINRDPKHFAETCVESNLEQGTVQTYYNWQRVTMLLEETSFKLINAYSVTHEDLKNPQNFYKRYHIIAQRRKS